MEKEKVDILDLNIPNVCFSHAKTLPEDDERLEKFKNQRLERGFDNTELWNLDLTIAQFILPRMKAFKEQDYNAIENKVLDKIIRSFEMVVEKGFFTNEEDIKEFQKGMKLFAKHYCELWN